MKTSTPPFELPTDMRKMTEQSIAQVRMAIDAYVQFLQRALPEDILGGSELSNKVLTFAERNLASAFEFGQRLLLVRDVRSLVQLQMEFIQRQTQAMTEQAFELREATTKTVLENLQSKFLSA
ncbi:MAG: phasin family protein [Xanthobacteraceae bacterium]